MEPVAHEEGLRPLNVFSASPEEIGRLMSNFTHAPFTLDGVRYASVEGFYVALRYLEPEERKAAAKLSGPVAKNMGR